MFLHRLEQRRLGLRRGAVDLVGQDDVGEDRPVDELELPPAVRGVLEDIRPRDVHRHQVGRELDAAELQRHRLGQLVDHQRLGQARHAHQQRMPAGEQADRQPLDHVVLADDHPAQLLAQPGIGIPQMVDRLDVVLAQPIPARCVHRLRHECILKGDSKGESPDRQGSRRAGPDAASRGAERSKHGNNMATSRTPTFVIVSADHRVRKGLERNPSGWPNRPVL